MLIASVKHKGLKRFLEDNDERGLRPDLIRKIRNVLTALIAAPSIESVRGPPGWRIHQLTADRAGTWSIAVSGNWRITFVLENDEILQLDLEDYH